MIANGPAEVPHRMGRRRDRAVTAAVDGDIIELRTNEALTLQAISSEPGRRLTLRAAHGYQPKYVDTTAFQLSAGHEWDIVNLKLRGKFAWDPAGGSIRRMQNCAWEESPPAATPFSYGLFLPCTHPSGADLEVVNCYVPGMVTVEVASDRKAVFRNSILQTWCVGVLGIPSKHAEQKLVLERCAVWEPFTWGPLPTVGGIPLDGKVLISANHCVFDGMHMGSFEQPRYQWSGDRNLFRFWYATWYWEAANKRSAVDLASWQKLWDSDAHSRAAAAVFHDPQQWRIFPAAGAPAPATGVDFTQFRRPTAFMMRDSSSSHAK